MAVETTTRIAAARPRVGGAGVRRFHRTIGVMVALSVLLSTVSGVLHVVMTWTQAPPPAARPSGRLDPAFVRTSLAEAVAAADGGTGLEAASLRSIGGEPWWQLGFAGAERASYVNARTGVADPAADERYAAEIASAFLGGVPVRHTARLTAFDSEYIAIFRILPVLPFDADDGKGTRVYVSTQTGSVTRHTNDWMQLEANVFSNLHKLAFIPNKILRDSVLATMTSGILVVAGLGLGLWLRTRRRTAR